MRKPLVFAVLVLAAITALWVTLSGSSTALVLRHLMESRLKRLSAVTTLKVGGFGEFGEAPPIRMFLNPGDHAITPTLWAHGMWEPNETYWFMRSVRAGDVVVDVGANVGYYTMLGARLVGESGRVYAFEPDPVSFEILQRNVRLNDLHNVVLEQKAVSNRAGSIRLYISPRNKGDHRIYQPEGEERQAVDVEAVSLDDYFEGVEDEVHYVKVDTQGAEGVILEGMMDLLRRSDDVVMAFEYSPRHLEGLGSSAEELLERLVSLELRMFAIGDGNQGVGPLRPVTSEQLLREFSPDLNRFTNLMLFRRRSVGR